MARKATDLVGVLLGEAVAGTPEERFADMLGIASVIENRAAATGVSPNDIISAPGQFSAYGKSLPPGAEEYADIAQLALDTVSKQGPVHNATFYATPAATKNLPSGLQPVASTKGHQYFTDPENRAIRTAVGYVAPTAPDVALSRVEPGLIDRLVSPASAAMSAVDSLFSRFSPTPMDVPSQTQPPTPRPDPTMGVLSYDLDNARRNQVPSSGIGWKVHDVANSVVPGIDTSLYSGMEPVGMAAVGAANRHPLGFAGDFTFSKAGQQITDPVAMHDIAMGMAAKYGANIGYSGVPGNYMGVGRMHIDTMPLGQFPGGAQWGPMAQSWADNLDFARATGIGPTPYSGAPTPTSRAGALAEVAQASREAEARSELGQSLADAGLSSLSGRAASMAAPVDRQIERSPLGPVETAHANRFDKMTSTPPSYDDFESRRAAAFSSMPAPSTATVANQPAATGVAQNASIDPTAVSSLSAFTAPSVASFNPTPISSLPTKPAAAPISPVRPTTVNPVAINRVPAPVVRPTPLPAMPVPTPTAVAQRANVAPETVRAAQPSFRAADVYSGRAPAGAQGVSTGGHLVSRDQFGNTTIENSYGARTTFDASGRMTSTPDSKIGGYVAERAPGVLGSMIGSAFGGPLGGLLGAMAGRAAAGQKPGGALGGLLGGLFGGGSGKSGKGGNDRSGGGSRGGKSGGGGFSPAGADRDNAGN